MCTGDEEEGAPTARQALSLKDSMEVLGLINHWEGPDNYPREKVSVDPVFSEATAILSLAGPGLGAPRKGWQRMNRLSSSHPPVSHPPPATGC